MICPARNDQFSLAVLDMVSDGRPLLCGIRSGTADSYGICNLSLPATSAQQKRPPSCRMVRPGFGAAMNECVSSLYGMGVMEATKALITS